MDGFVGKAVLDFEGMCSIEDRGILAASGRLERVSVSNASLSLIWLFASAISVSVPVKVIE